MTTFDRFHVKTLGLIAGTAAIAASAVFAVSHDGGGPGTAATVVAKANYGSASGTFTTPSATVAAGGGALGGAPESTANATGG